MANAIGRMMASNSWRLESVSVGCEFKRGRRDKAFRRCREEALGRGEGARIGEACGRVRIEPTAGDNVLRGWPENMIWITLNAIELRGCRFQHVAQLTRSTT